MYKVEGNVQGGGECTGWRGMYRMEGNVCKIEGSVQSVGLYLKCTDE